ncbi:hypothetical protein [Halalkalibacter krulwichiae]|uniref:Phenylhydantoinase n=1 Tax=Halalkalibacter krulwichiae TaxID=199441 RepID=A0A1X9MIC0_9BACI|nr:hypothetical protein [Halalkalibacter krulwichiae]ARK30322.1 phenylhydantoinase [Halalkalibacter krulwichiae]
MYLLDKAIRVEDCKRTLRSYLIKDGQIQYVTKTFEKWNKRRVAMNGIAMADGRVMFDDGILKCTDFHGFQKRQIELIRKGCTTIAAAPNVKYEKDIEAELKRAKHSMASSTLDYTIGLTIPIKLLRPSLLRVCQQHRIPFLKVQIESFSDIKHLPWTHISQTLLTYHSVLIPDFNLVSEKFKDLAFKEWMRCCERFQIHTDAPMQSLKRWSKTSLQKVGLYPKKGVLLNGSDADYLLFHINETQNQISLEQNVARQAQNVYDEKEPVIVVLKSEIIKSNEQITLRPGFGRLVEVKRPGRFLSLSDVSYYEQLHRQLSSS